MSHERSTSARFNAGDHGEVRAVGRAFVRAIKEAGPARGQSKFEMHYDAEGVVTIVSRHRREPDELDAIVERFESTVQAAVEAHASRRNALGRGKGPPP